MKWIARFLVGLAVLAIPAVAKAQAITSYKITVTGGVSPVTNDLPVAGWTCGLARVNPPAGTTHNPTDVRIFDPADATKDCRYTDPGNGPLLSLPFGGTVYTATIQAQNSVGLSTASAVSNPFDRPGVAPTAPTGLRVLQ